MGLESDLKRYYKDIRKHLFCSRKAQIDFLAEAHRLVDDFLENQPDAAFGDIVKNVGEPAELAEAFLNTLPDTEVERFRKARRKQKRLAIALPALVMIVLVGAIIYISWVRRATTISEGTVLPSKRKLRYSTRQTLRWLLIPREVLPGQKHTKRMDQP